MMNDLTSNDPEIDSMSSFKQSIINNEIKMNDISIYLTKNNIQHQRLKQTIRLYIGDYFIKKLNEVRPVYISIAGLGLGFDCYCELMAIIPDENKKGGIICLDNKFRKVIFEKHEIVNNINKAKNIFSK
jgi:hypothetical protein